MLREAAALLPPQSWWRRTADHGPDAAGFENRHSSEAAVVQVGALREPNQAASLAQQWHRYISGYPTKQARMSNQTVVAMPALAAANATR